MMNSIRHIGLHVTENDVDLFYKALFDFEIERIFTLTRDNAFCIFGMPIETTVLVGKCPELELELFLQKRTTNESFNHICFSTVRLTQITAKAKRNGFNYTVRQPSGTVFLRDSNSNIFELIPTIHSENND